jgi:transcriptional regulator with XRE-family HTH domain
VDQGWLRVGEAIRQRVVDLALSKAEVIRRSDVSDKTLTGYMRGEPIVRADKRRRLCEALGWSPESIDLILNGGEPELVEPSQDQRLDAVEERLAVVEAQIGDVSSRVDEIRRLVERLLPGSRSQ